MEVIFVSALLLSAYSYGIYPIALGVFARFFGNAWYQADERPTLSIVVSAFNESAVIEQKVRNALAADYPANAIDVVVASDGSTDDTTEIVRAIRDDRVSAYAFPRQGKTACLNDVMPHLRGEIVVFTDANSMFPSELLQRLARNFADPSVGLVTGWTRYVHDDNRRDDEAIGMYAGLERRIKILESQIDSCVGADGAVFGMRRHLYRPLANEDINDFVIPLDVIRQGKRVVLDPEVFCVEPSAPSTFVGEYRRQVRVTTRTLRAIRTNANFLNLFRYPWFGFFLWSHKVLRFLAPAFFAAVFLSNLFLLGRSPIYAATLCVQLALMIIAALGFLGLRVGGLSDTVCLFAVTSIAQLVALARTALGITDTTWTPQR